MAMCGVREHKVSEWAIEVTEQQSLRGLLREQQCNNNNKISNNNAMLKKPFTKFSV